MSTKRRESRKSDRATWAEDRARAEELWGAWLAAPPGPEREAACRAWLEAHGRVEALYSPDRLVEWIEAALPGLEGAERVERAAARAHGGGPPDLARLAEERDFAFRGAAQMGVDPPEPTEDPLLHLARLRRRLLPAAGARPRRGRRAPPVKPLTDRQADAMYMVAECQGNVTEAARRLGRSPKTVRQHYNAAMGKLSQKIVQKPLTGRLPADHRGQASVAGPDDGPAASEPRPARVARDRRRG